MQVGWVSRPHSTGLEAVALLVCHRLIKKNIVDSSGWLNEKAFLEYLPLVRTKVKSTKRVTLREAYSHPQGIPFDVFVLK